MRSGLWAVLGASILLAGGCAASGPKCSSEEVINTIKQIAAKKVSELVVLSGIFDLDKTTYSVNAIRTDSGDATTCSCKADLVIIYKISDKMKEARKESPDLYKQTLGDGVRDDMYKDKHFDISYKAQLTDDRKQTHVEVMGLE